MGKIGMALYTGELLNSKLYSIWAERLRVGSRRENRIFGISIGWVFFGFIWAAPIDESYAEWRSSEEFAEDMRENS